MPLSLLLLLHIALSFSALSIAAPPNLPTGLNKPVITPARPTGSIKPPSLPNGLASTPQKESTLNETSFVNTNSTLSISGYWDVRSGIRTKQDPNENQQSLNEARLQLKLQAETRSSVISLTGDLLADTTTSQHAIDLDSGQGWIDLREANIVFSPFSFIDIKLGRQILTWGTGDLIFINDLFPKDWQAFFIGRDLEYLKAPSNALKTSFFSHYANLDIIYTPRFDADRSISGEKISFYNPLLNSLAGKQAIIQPQKPHHDEISLRLYKILAPTNLLYTLTMAFGKAM